MKLRRWQKIQTLHIYALSISGVMIELIFALRGAVSKIQADFQNCHIWALNLAIGQSARSCTCTLSTPRGWNWAYFSSTGSGLRDMGLFSKLPYLSVKLGNLPNLQKLHIYSLLPQRTEIEITFNLQAVVWEIRADFKNCHIWAWNLAKVPKLYINPLQPNIPEKKIGECTEWYQNYLEHLTAKVPCIH